MSPDAPTQEIRFTRTESLTMMSGRVVRWIGEVPWENKPEVSASRYGVLIQGGWPVMAAGAVDDLRRVLDLAWREHWEMALGWPWGQEGSDSP